MFDEFIAKYWHGIIEPIVVAVVTGMFTLCCWLFKRIFSAFMALALARENAQDERLNRLEAWRLRTESAAGKVNGLGSGEDAAPDSRSAPRHRRRNAD